ncbi:MAG: hypothetical protein CVT98_01355 [Bacteroidetes bacterium HGW-Bacteroidetes-15]|nr:MAG: hypothetical protein CVT98_01355 [Bacteroidetes bacterium HGW-Bacteroidetes-15]
MSCHSFFQNINLKHGDTNNEALQAPYLCLFYCFADKLAKAMMVYSSKNKGGLCAFWFGLQR